LITIVDVGLANIASHQKNFSLSKGTLKNINLPSLSGYSSDACDQAIASKKLIRACRDNIICARSSCQWIQNPFAALATGSAELFG
jgi:hypothetical protein